MKGFGENFWSQLWTPKAFSKITQKGGFVLALTTRLFSPFKIWLLQKMGRSFNFLQICPFQKRKHLPLSTVWFCIFSTSPLNMVSLHLNMHLPSCPNSECNWIIVSSGLLPKKSHMGEMLTLASRQGKVSSQISQDHLRWRSVLGKGSAI